MNSQQTTCFLHCSQVQYFCQDCDISLCETCLLQLHYQHTLNYYVLLNRNLIYYTISRLEIKKFKWKTHQMALRIRIRSGCLIKNYLILNSSMQTNNFKEKQNINLRFNKPLSKNHYLQIQNQILNSDHQTIVFKYLEKIITQNQDLDYDDHQQLYLNAIGYNLNQNLWQKLCLQLSFSKKLQILSINLCNSTLNTNQLQQLIESISNLQNLLYVELDMKHTIKVIKKLFYTYLDDNSIQVIFGVMKIQNLIKFIAYITQCNIAVDIVYVTIYSNILYINFGIKINKKQEKSLIISIYIIIFIHLDMIMISKKKQ